MSRLPRRLLRDTITFEPYVGEGAAGPVYGEPFDVVGKVAAVRQLVLSSGGVEAISDTTVYLDPEDAVAVVPESRTTIAGRVSKVISVAPQSRPGEDVLVKVVCA